MRPRLAACFFLLSCQPDPHNENIMTDNTASPLKPCPKCGQPAEVVKAGSRRFWVQCSRYAGQGTCSAIGSQADNRKEAMANWNKMR